MSQLHIPDEMTAVVLDSYSGIDGLRVEKRPVPRPGHNEVLVKMAATVINPSDLAFIEGNYGFQKPTPTIPGFEGSGTVVATGSGFMGRYLRGKRVACVTQSKGDGIWAEYVVTASSYALPLNEAVSLEQGAMSIVNPLTALALLTIARQGKHRAILNTGAASALGQMMNRLARESSLQVVNVVRREAQVEFLKQQGATLVLNSSESDFEQQLHQVCHQHQVHLAFDAVAGSLTAQLITAMPPNSKVTVYGGLSFQPAQADGGELIFQNKRVDGFWLTAWLGKKNFLQNLMLWRRAQKLMTDELKTEIRARYPLAKVRQAITEYQNQMTGGKILLVPDQKST